MLLSEQVNFRKITIRRNKMNKIKNMLVAVIAITFLSTNAFAGNFGLGVTGSIAVIEGVGTESETANTGTENSVRTANASNNAAIGSLFAEYTFESIGGLTFGVDYIPGSADVNSKKMTRTNVTADAKETNQQDGDSTAQATVENHLTYYVEVPVHAGLYGKLGYVEMDVITAETMPGTSGTYGNTSTNGYTYGIGYKNEIGASTYYKVEGTTTEFDTISLASGTTNTIKADLDVTKLTFALGYKF